MQHENLLFIKVLSSQELNLARSFIGRVRKLVFKHQHPLEEILVRRTKQQSAGVVFLFFIADKLFRQRITPSSNYIHKLSQLFNRCQCTSDTTQVAGCFSSLFKRQKPFLRQSNHFIFLCQKINKDSNSSIGLGENNLKYKCHLLLVFSKAWL